MLGLVFTGWVNVAVAAGIAVVNGIIFTLLYQALEKLRQYLSGRFPEDFFKERRRLRLEKRARRQAERKEKAV